MKKNFFKLGALLVALALVFAACAQPTEESSNSNDTIIRLWFEDGTTPLIEDDKVITITLGRFNDWTSHTTANENAAALLGAIDTYLTDGVTYNPKIDTGAVPVKVSRTKEGAYIDFLLYDTTAGRSQVYQKSGSFYVFLDAVAGNGSLEGVHVYTPDATARNQHEREFPLSGDPIYNSNVKRFSFGTGVNELRLEYFSE